MQLRLPAFSEEPLVYVGLVNAAIALGIAFGVPVDAAIKVSVDGLIMAGSLVFVRSQVSSPATVASVAQAQSETVSALTKPTG